MKYDYVDSLSGANATHFGNKLFIYGTHDGTDISKDADIIPVAACGTIGHRGAYTQAEWLYNHVNWGTVREIHGHSLGGAVALWLGKMTELPVVTYGAFRPFYVPTHGTSINYVYGYDIVPRLGFFTYGVTARLKGDGFHPFTDHLAYPQLEYYK